MLIGVLSDIHSNVIGLSRALKILKENGADKIVCLGDVVGYGNDPTGAMELVSTYCDIVIKGNHDYAVSTDCSLVFYNEFAKKIILKQRKKIGNDGKLYLNNLPLSVKEKNVTFVHASLPNPEQWLYPARTVNPENQIIYVIPRDIFKSMETDFLFVGHSHEPGIIFQSIDGTIRFSSTIPNHWVNMKNSRKTIIDVGSVSMPRGEGISTCLLFNAEKGEFKFLKFKL